MNKLLFAFLTILLFSCKNLVDRNILDQECDDIYNLALDNTTGSDTFVRYHLKIPSMLPQLPKITKADSLQALKFQKWQDSLKSILDTAELFVVVTHKIDTLSSSDVNNIRETITSNKNNLTDKMNGDTSFNETIKELCNNKKSCDTLDASKLKTKFNYKIYSDNSFPNDQLRQIGRVSFSKIGFSRKKDKAVVYTSFICGRLCGAGQILFFEKINGIWEYFRTWEMWVS